MPTKIMLGQMYDIEFEADPQGKYGTTPGQALTSLGLIPYFGTEAVGGETVDEVCDIMGDCYGFMLDNWNFLDYGGQITEDLTYVSEEDPDMYPTAVFSLQKGIKVVTYPYSLVLVTNGHTKRMTRMD